MSAGNQLDANVLSWVKSEIDETLGQARSALEVYVENTDDESQLRFCLNYLHQVHGTLQMVELYGASLAAEEMEKLTEALVENKVSNRNDAFEVLIRGILQLPDYLEQLLNGQQDMPMVLLPLLNDLRAARGEALLSENAMFTPDLSVDAPSADEAEDNDENKLAHSLGLPGEDLAELAKKLRHHYHLGLLGWFRDKDSDASLKRIADVINKLRHASNEKEVSRLLWIASGLVESLRLGGLDPSVSVKLLLGQLDRQIKKIIDDGVYLFSENPPSELLKNILYYIATSSADGELTQQIKQAFDLEHALPDTRQLEQARADLQGPNQALMGTVSSVLMEDLARVKDGLDVIVRAENPDPTELDSLCSTLAQMSDTLGMLGLGLQRRTILEQIDVLKAMVSGEQSMDEVALMDVAAAMLSIENSLQEMSTARAINESVDEESDKTATEQLHGSEQHKLMQTVIDEIKIDLAKVKEAISDYSRNTMSPEVVSEVPAILAQIKGSLAILSLDRAAGLLEQSAVYVEQHILKAASAPSSTQLENLADSISSIEYYLESMAGNWGHPDTILDYAEQSMAKLQEAVAGGSATSDTVSSETASKDKEDDTVIDLVAPDASTDSSDTLPEIEGLEIDGSAIDAPPVITAEDDTLTDISLADITEPSLQMPQPGEFNEDESGLVLEGFDDLPSDLEVSLETDDSDQSSSSLQIEGMDFEDESLPLDNSISLEIDGLDSPSMSGLVLESEMSAVTAEDSISLEMDELDSSSSSLDDLVIDVPTPETEEDSSDISSISLEMDDLDVQSSSDLAIEVPPAEIEEDSSDISSISLEMDDLDVQSSSDLAIEVPIAEIEEDSSDTSSVSLEMAEPLTSSAENIAIESVTSAAETTVAQEHEVGDEIDDEIIEIFLEEAEEEYANIQRLLPMWESNLANEEPLRDMRRSFHTLKGSGRLVGAVDVGEFAWAFENMLNRVIDHTIQTDAVLFEVLHRARDTLPSLFELFRTQGKPGQDVLTLMSYADALSKGEDVVLEEPEKEPVILEPEEVNVSEEVAGPLDIDPVLLDIYRKEAQAHIDTLKSYVQNWKSGSEQNATYELLRALHTLNGSSRTAGVKTLSELCSEFEKFVKDIEGKPFSSSAVEVLEYVIEFAEQTLDVLDKADGVLPDNGALYLAIVELANEQSAEDTIQIDTIDIAHEEEIEIVPDVADSQEVTEAVPSEEPQAVAQDVAADVSLPATEPSQDLDDDIDEELLEIFIEEGEEILDESDHTIHQWIQTPDDAELVEALQRQLHTLKGGARMAGISEIGDLGHDIESMLTAVVDGHLAVSKEMQNLLQKSQDRLVSMLEQVKARKRPEPANDLILQVNAILGGKGDTAEVDTAPEPESEDSPATIETVAEVTPVTETEEPVSEPEAEKHTPIDWSDFSLNKVVSIDRDQATKPAEPVEEPVTASPEVTVEKQPAEVTEPEVDEEQEIVQADEQLPAEIALEKEKHLAADDDDGSRDRRKGSRIQHEQIRVRSDLLDNLVNFAGEVSIYRSRMEQQTNTFRFNLEELDETIERFREQLRQFEIEAEAQIQYRKEDTLAQGYDDFDPLEMDRFTQMQHLSRGMLESLGDLDSLRNILSNITRESETLLVQQSRVTSELQEGLMRTRMVQVSGHAPRLRRIVRQVSDEMGKPVEFQMHGMDNEMDRTVLDRVIPPIEHMLRNAIAHGIEKPAQRKQAGKQEQGKINLSFEREGGEFVIRISDDGMGINLRAIRAKAIEKGMLSADANPSKEALLELMMQSGFSTAEEVTQIAGRGVGMDVVNTEIKQLGGHLEISTLEGKGTVFTVSMPLTLAVSRALMVSVGEETYAIPLLSVEGVERLSYNELLEISQMEDPVYHWVGHDYQYMHLSSIMGMHEAITFDENRSVPILLVRSGGYRAAIQVDRLIGSREIVVKPVGPQLSTLRGVSGATIMGDGSVVLIIDPAMLVRLVATEKDLMPVAELMEQAASEEQAAARVMVVDDSITVRKVTTRFLERNDLVVSTAKDGVDALGQLQLEENKPDVMLLDVEMPRMDGFELATNIRNDDRLKDIPIIMITSRTGTKHRDRAMNIGVNVYLGKPYNESELLEHIHQLTGK